MKEILIQRAIALLFSMFSAQEVREYIDDLLDKVEDRHAGDSSKDQAVTATVNLIRALFAIPDDIGGDPD